MTQSTLVSVIVPVYKCEDYIGDCVGSITSQSYKNLDIVLVEDGSPDRAGNICDALAKEDSRIRVIHQANHGVSSARNRGIAVARGEYLLFVDSDDRLEPGGIDAMMNALPDNETLDIIKGNHWLLNSQGKRIENPFTQNRTLFEGKTLKSQEFWTEIINCHKVVWATMFRTEFLRQNHILFADDLTMGEDNLFMLKACSRMEKGIYISARCYLYNTYNGASITHEMSLQTIHNLINSLPVIRKSAECANPFFRETAERICGMHIYYAVLNAAKLTSCQARNQVRKSLKHKQVWGGYFKNSFQLQLFYILYCISPGLALFASRLKYRFFGF